MTVPKVARIDHLLTMIFLFQVIKIIMYIASPLICVQCMWYIVCVNQGSGRVGKKVGF